MSTTVFILAVWVLLGRFDSDYSTDTHGSAALGGMGVATILAILWDLSVLMS